MPRHVHLPCLPAHASGQDQSALLQGEKRVRGPCGVGAGCAPARVVTALHPVLLKVSAARVGARIQLRWIDSVLQAFRKDDHESMRRACHKRQR
eukprot:940781-Rhodomonas_salina.2